MDALASRFVIFKDKSTGENDKGLNYNLQYGFHQNQNKEIADVIIDINNNWTVNFDTQMGGPKTYQLEELADWASIENDGIKYYSGSADYSREFSVSVETLSDKTQVFVVFEDIQEIARVSVNGNDCGVVWTPPYKANITQQLKEGTNNITVQVINNWNNRIVGDLRNPGEKEYARTNAKKKFTKESPLLESGLIGKAEIIFTNGDE